MNKTKQYLIKKAKKTYKNISPCGGKTQISDCFTAVDHGKKLVLWFNTPDNNTHILVEKISA